MTAFNFARHGEATTAFDRTQQGTVDKYVRQTLEQDVRARAERRRPPGALFRAQGSRIGSVRLEILADPALSKVVRTALSPPDATATMDIDKQVELILEAAERRGPEGSRVAVEIHAPVHQPLGGGEPDGPRP